MKIATNKLHFSPIFYKKICLFCRLEAYRIPKPKGRWWRTFYRRQTAAQDAEYQTKDNFIIAAKRYLKMG